MQTQLSIVIPAYNESERLPATIKVLSSSVRNWGLAKVVDPALVDIWIIDDGSSDGTGQTAKSLAQKFPQLKIQTSRLDRNSGKGAAIRQGLKLAAGKWILIADADSATHWESLVGFMEHLHQENMPIALFGSRAAEGAITHGRSPGRNLGARLLNKFIRLLTGTNLKDTQCGFKLLPWEWASAFAEYGQQNRFSWDIELVVFLNRRNLPVAELPVEWSHRPGSKLRPVRDALRMVWDTVRIVSRRP